jgi:hypothetical protein
MLHGHPGIEVFPVVEMGRVELFNALTLHLLPPLHLIKGHWIMHAGREKKDKT